MTNNQFSKNKRDFGFSLIELIVVMTIMMLISTIGLITFTASNQKARDGKRIADIEKIRLALEMARQVGSTYPVAVNFVPTVLVNQGFMSTYPVDPKTPTNRYLYERVNNYQYNLYATMENVGTTNYSAGTTCGPGVNCNYRVSSP